MLQYKRKLAESYPDSNCATAVAQFESGRIQLIFSYKEMFVWQSNFFVTIHDLFSRLFSGNKMLHVLEYTSCKTGWHDIHKKMDHIIVSLLRGSVRG